MADLSLFRYSHLIEVRYADLDVLGHLNNAKYFTYMETARMRYFVDVLGWHGEWHTLGVILARAACDFKIPLVYGDMVRVYVRTLRIGSKSFDMVYALVREQDQALAATGGSVMVAYDYKANASMPIPAEWRARITAYEPGLQPASTGNKLASA